MPRLVGRGLLAAAFVLLQAGALGRPGAASAQAPEASAAGDSARIESFPIFPQPASGAPGVAFRWDHSDLLASGALTFGDLIEFAPQLTAVRAGFLEGPQAAIFAGAGSAGLRFSVDGYEIAPLAGGALDTHLISLVEQQRLLLVREPGGFRVAAEPYRRDRPEAYSRIEGGTGDRSTNQLRGFFASGFAGALVGIGFDRIDTSGSLQLGSAEQTTLWANVTRKLPAGVWGQLEFRNATTDRDSFPSPDRTDWIVRLRRPFPGGWHADLVAGTSRLDREPVFPTGAAVSVAGAPREVSARQIALRGARTAANWRAFIAFRFWDGDGVPDYEPRAAVELRAGPASFYASGSYAEWGDFSAAAGYAAFHVKLPLGLRATAEIEDGERGLFGGRPEKRQAFTRWTAGAELALWRWKLVGRTGRWRVDPSPALGQPFDSATSLPGGTVWASEASARGPLFELFGGSVEVGGGFRTREAGPFLYWPQDEWRLEGQYRLLTIHRQLEVRLTGVGGIRGAMQVPDASLGPGATRLTQDLTWFSGEVVVRIKDVHIFYTYELFNAVSGPRDVPGFRLPRTRTYFGLKWEFWN